MNKRLIAAAVAVVLAIAGIVTLMNYASGANDRAFNNAKLVSVLQVTETVPEGTKASDLSSKVKTIKIPQVAVARGAVKSLTELNDLATNTELEPGEQILVSRFGTPDKAATPKSKSAVPAGMQELTISLDAARALSGTLSPGDKVGVIASYQTKEGDGVTQLIRNFVPVLKVGTGTAGGQDNAGGGTQMITLAVFTRDAGKIINAIEFGKVWLTKQNSNTTTGSGGSISRNDVTG